MYEIAQLIPCMLLGIGSDAYFAGVFAHSRGERALVLISLASLATANAWVAASESYESLLVAQCLAGIGPLLNKVIRDFNR